MATTEAAVASASPHRSEIHRMASSSESATVVLLTCSTTQYRATTAATIAIAAAKRQGFTTRVPFSPQRHRGHRDYAEKAQSISPRDLRVLCVSAVNDMSWLSRYTHPNSRLK